MLAGGRDNTSPQDRLALFSEFSFCLSGGWACTKWRELLSGSGWIWVDESERIANRSDLDRTQKRVRFGQAGRQAGWGWTDGDAGDPGDGAPDGRLSGERG